VCSSDLRLRENDQNVVDEDEDEDMVTHRANASICNTDSGVIFEGSNIISNIQELILEHGELQYKTSVSRSQKLLNPNTTMELLWASIQRCENEDVKQFCRCFGTAIGNFLITFNIF
jgi:hypothetical protein